MKKQMVKVNFGFADDFGDFLFETFGVSNFVEVYPRDYGYHYAENSVSYLFDLLD